MGIQYGFDVLYPYYRRWVFGSGAKLGVYFNLPDGRTVLVNNGNLELFDEADETQIAFEGEVYLHASYKILPNVSLQAAYEIWYLYGGAFARDQVSYTVNPFTGTSMSADDDIFIQGTTAGVHRSRSGWSE